MEPRRGERSDAEVRHPHDSASDLSPLRGSLRWTLSTQGSCRPAAGPSPWAMKLPPLRGWLRMDDSTSRPIGRPNRPPSPDVQRVHEVVHFLPLLLDRLL